MNARERVKRLINRQEVDKIPYSFDLTTVIMNKLSVHYGIDSDKVLHHIGDNLKYVYYSHPSDFQLEKVNEGHYRDEFGVTWDKGEKVQNIGDWGGIISSPLKEPDLAGYKFPDPRKKGRFSGLNEKELLDTNRYIVLSMDGVLDIGWHIRGFENLMMDFASEENFVNELLDKVLEFNLGIIEEIPPFVDGIRFGEDWGQQKGLLMGGKFWRKYLKPRLKIMYEAARKRGFNVLIHTCGDITELFPDIIELGVEVVHPIQPEVMDVAAIKTNYGRDIVLYGGLGCQSTIPLGTVKEVLAEAQERLELLGKYGGYIFGPAGAIPTDAKIENVIALIEYARNCYI
jgi:uroporphyrinogen decarboxylase